MNAVDVAWMDPKAFYLAHAADQARSFWLDGSGARSWSGRMSYVGWLEPDELSLTWHAARRVVTAHRSGRTEAVGDDIFTAMSRYTPNAELDTTSGWFGYFGYAARPDLPARLDESPEAVDACWLRATRYVAFDHDLRRVHAISPSAERDTWMSMVAAMLATGSESSSSTVPDPGLPRVLNTWALPGYERAFSRVQAELLAGNSYETNLTFRTTVASSADPLHVYLRLRRLNPAPYAALIRHDAMMLLSSSPERFATIDSTGRLETRPIKGTTPRDPDPEVDAEAARRLGRDAKYRAENLITVDLLRNDLAQVCQPGTVTVSELMHVESYATVHQLVSTISGQLDAAVSSLDAVRALWPGGSMTGAPKRRTMQIIADVEATPRGIYSGAVGWLGADGRADLGIVIRSLVWRDGVYTLGTGGAITVMSDCAEEYAEAALKMETMMAALWPDRGQAPGLPISLPTP